MEVERIKIESVNVDNCDHSQQDFSAIVIRADGVMQEQSFMVFKSICKLRLFCSLFSSCYILF